MPGMLNEQKAQSCVYDASRRTARVEVSSGGGPERESAGTLLLDAAGRLVGVDVEPDGASRAVVMVGAHEAVARTVSARLLVSRDGSGRVAHIVVQGIDAPR
jgi:hypothetical protein